MLAALLENNNNTQPSPQPVSRLPTVKIDRGGGGPSLPSFDIVDIVGAISAFPEISGEHPVTRAARRHRWIGEALPVVRDAREKREARAFLAGATLANAAAEERHAAIDAQRDLMDGLKIEQLVEIIDSVRCTATPTTSTATLISSHERGDRDASNSSGGGLGVFIGGLIVGGIVVGAALASRRDRR